MSRPRRLRTEAPALALLAAMLLVGLYLRVKNNGYGLPFVYYADEGSHFTNRAVEMLGGSFNPHYFQNPSAFTYIEHFALRLYFGHGWPFADYVHAIRLYGNNPTRIYEIGRTVAALVCLAGVCGVYGVARALWDRRTGLVAAAVLCFAFLTVAYSRIAVTDVGTLLPVALTLWCAIRLHERGGLRWCAGAGVAAGVAIGFKYTAGLVLLSPLLALALGARRDWRAALRGLVLMVACAAVAFFVTTPYFFLDFSTAERQLRAQADLAGGLSKYGQEHDNGILYYAKSLLWGLGWLPLLAAIGGFVALVRRDRARAALLVVFPVVLFAYLATQQRYFGRWFLPSYPAFALLAGVGVVQGLGALRRVPARLVPAALVAIMVVVLWQPVAADTRSMAVLGKADTREIARTWLVDNMPQSLRVVIEPAVPARFYWKLHPNGARVPHRKQFVRGFIRDIRDTHVEYGRTLSPAVVDRYRRSGYCLVMTFSLIEGRSVNARDPRALAYYARLKRESTRIFSVSPYRAGVTPPRFNFDLSYNYYPTAFLRPGPAVDIYRLHDCTQRYGQLGSGT